MNKQRSLGIIILVVFICGLCLVIKNVNQSPYDFLKNTKSSSEAERAKELLYQDDDGNNKYIVFYVNENDNAACAIINKGYFSYNTLRISSEVLIANETEPADFHFSLYNKGQDWIYWGIIRDDKIRQVLINEKEANLVDTAYGFRICYLIGTEPVEPIEPEHELIY